MRQLTDLTKGYDNPQSKPGVAWAWLYASGYVKPNYPMPAIRTAIEILPTRVVLWTWYNGSLDYQYLA